MNSDRTRSVATLEEPDAARGVLSAAGRRVSRLAADVRGQALTEYVILFGAISLVCFWLYYPHNGFYSELRAQYDRTTTVLMWLGP